MEKETAERLVRENEEYKIRDDYSGRGMYGRETYAVVVPDRDDVGYIKKTVDNTLRWDNMALDFIVY